MSKRIICFLLTILMLVGMLPVGVMAAVEEGDKLIYDFKSFAIKAAQTAQGDSEHWWNKLAAGGDSTTRVIGSASYGKDMANPEYYNGVSNSVQASLAEENWGIYETGSRIASGSYAKRVWFNADETIPWGIALNTYWANAPGKNNHLPARARLVLTIDVETAGQYRLDAEAWFEAYASGSTNAQTTAQQGAGYANIYVNDVLAAEFFNFGADVSSAETKTVASQVTLTEGSNTVIIEASASPAGAFGSNRTIYLNKLIFTQIICSHENQVHGTEILSGNVHTEYTQCGDCGLRLGETMAACVEGEEELICGICGGEMLCTHKDIAVSADLHSAVLGFSAVKKADGSKYWDDLPNAADGVDDTKAIICGKMDEAAEAAYEAFLSYLKTETGITIDETVTGTLTKSGQKLYLTKDERVKWGIAFFAGKLADNTDGSMTEDNRLDLTASVSKAGYYQVSLDVVQHNVSTSIVNAITGSSCGGGTANVYLDGELIVEDYDMAKANNASATIDLGMVYLTEGDHTVTVRAITDINGNKGTGGRRMILISGLELMRMDAVCNFDGTHTVSAVCENCQSSWKNDPAECVDENGDKLCDLCGYDQGCEHTETDGYLEPMGRNRHQRYEICANDACKKRINGQLENCVDNDADLICDLCSGVIIDLPDDPRHIIIDFKEFAKTASKQSWWDKLVPANHVDTRMIGKLSAKDEGMTEDQQAAYKEMRRFLEMNYSWNINEEITALTSSTPKRVFFNITESQAWGLCYYAGYLNAGGHQSELAFDITIPEGGEGWYNLTIDAYKEDTSGKSPTYTNTSATNPGGGFADVLVNGEEIYNEYSFTGKQLVDTHSMGAVYLKEGVNTVSFDAIKDINGGTTNGRRQVLLKGMELKPLDPVEVPEYLSSAVTLNETYLSYDAMLDGMSVAVESDLIAGASVNASGVVTVSGIAQGETAVKVMRNGETLCSIPVKVTEFTGTLDDLQGSPAKVDFMVFADRAVEQSWWAELGEGDVKTADTSDAAVLDWLDTNTRWNLTDGEMAVNGGNEKYGIAVADETAFTVSIPAEGLYGVTVEYLQMDDGAGADFSVNGSLVYEDLSTKGETRVIKASLGSVLLTKGENTFAFATNGTVKLRSVTFTPLGSRQVEAGAKQYVDLNETYLPFDAVVSAYTAASANSAVAAVSIDADGDLVIEGKTLGETAVTISGPETFTIVVKVVEAGTFRSVAYTLDGMKAVTLGPGTVSEGILTGLTTQDTQLSEKQLRLEGFLYFVSSNTKAVTVDQSTGDVTAVGEGSATVSSYVLLDGVSKNDAVTVVVTDHTDLASIDIYAQQEYVGIGSTLKLSVSGLKSSGVSADMDLYPVTWTVDEEETAAVSENGRLTGIKKGAVTVTATASVNGMPVSDTMVVEVVEDSELPDVDVIVDFTDSRGPDLETATVEENGFELNRELTWEGGSKINYAGKYGLLQAGVVGRVLAVDVHVPHGGWYTTEVTGARFTGGGLADIFVDDLFAGVINFGGANGVQYEGGGEYNTVWLDAGVHTFKIVSITDGSVYLGKLCLRATSDPNEIVTSLSGKTLLIPKEKAELDLSLQPANDRGDFTLKNVTETPDYSNYYILSSTDPSVVAVSGTTMTAMKPGGATITAACQINHAEVIRTIEVTVVEGTVVSAELTAEETTVKPDMGEVQLTLTTYGTNGAVMELPADTSVSYVSENTAVVSVSDSGLVTVKGVEGSAKVTAVINEKGREITAEIWITVTAGKTQPTLFTYEERAIAQENVLKYSWAWEEKEAVLATADFIVENLDTFYDLYFHDVFPRSIYVGNRNDPMAYYCRYCNTYLASNWSVYPWEVDPINNPWKITCPACKRDFPSNDFGAFYESGLDEFGNFSYELADRSLLVNELYPEMGEGWGVDDGKGFFTNNPETGASEMHTYIAYYVHCLYESLGKSKYSLNKILPELWKAYIYTGDEKYGSAGAILINRLADIYPGYDTKNHSADYSVADGNGYTGKFVGSIWEAVDVTQYLAQAADAFWPAMDNPDVVEYIRERKEKEGMDPALITPEWIRSNVDNGILLEIKKAVEGAQADGNFGMEQAGMTFAAVALDRLPETEEMIDWVFRYGERATVNGVTSNTGGSVLYNIIDLVDRDGFGNEGSYAYNAMWYENLMLVADALSGYTRVEGADLWANPKFVNMVGAMMKLTMCGTITPSWGESGHVQFARNGMDVDSMLTGFINSGNRDLAVAIFAANGNTVEGLHGSIYTKDPEGGLRTKIQQIVNEEGKFDFSESNMMSGLGLAVLREGPATLLKGINEAQFSDYWMQFGITGSGHSNLDSLNIGLDAFGLELSPDLGYPTVVATTDPERMQWTTATSSHNLVIVNDRAQSKIMTNSFPLHFDDAGVVKLIDAESPGAYGEADIYRRTLVTVDNGDGVSYAVDFFRVLGGTEHVYSFHAASTIDPKVEGLTMVQQAMGTYAGPNIPFGFWQTNPYSPDSAASNIGSGYSWLDDVYRDDTPETTFSIDWSIEDFHHRLTTSTGIHLKLTMLSEEPMAEVALANGRTPQNQSNPSHLEYAMIRKSGSSDMDTLFTSVIEPYQLDSYIAKSELVDVELMEGTETVTDRAAAIKVTLKSGREDYIVYATNPDCLYEIDGKFQFQGFAGVCSYEDGGLVYAYGNEAVQVAEVIVNALPAITGTVKDFTKELSDTYTMTIEVEQNVTATDFEGRYIYVENDRVENGAYRIYGAQIEGKTVVLDLYTQDLIRNYVDATDLDSGFVYNIAEDQRFTIPLSTYSNIGQFFTYTTDQVVKTGSRVSLKTGISGAGYTYAAEELPTGARLDAGTGTLTWSPSRTQVGRYPITVKAVQDGEVVGEMSFVIFVVPYTGSTYAADVCTHAKAVVYEADGMIETVCPACSTITKTEAESTQKFDVAGANMTLGNELKLNVLVNSSDLANGNYTAQITHKGETTEAVFERYNSSYQYVTIAVAAKEMADTITVEVYDENGNVVSNPYEISVRAYAMKVLANTAMTEKVKTLVVDMLNYGAEAQNYFGYNTANLANALLTDAQKALETEAVTCTNRQVKGANFYGTNLSLEDSILLNLYFRNCKADMYAKVVYTDYKGRVQTVEKSLAQYSGSLYRVTVNDIVLADAFSTVTVTVYNADGTVHGTVTDSVESYAARANQNALNEAIMKFAYSAKQYLS